MKGLKCNHEKIVVEVDNSNEFVCDKNIEEEAFVLEVDKNVHEVSSLKTISSVFIEDTTSQDLLRSAPSSLGVAFTLSNIVDFEGIVYKPQSVCVNFNGNLRGQLVALLDNSLLQRQISCNEPVSWSSGSQVLVPTSVVYYELISFGIVVFPLDVAFKAHV
ncbi:hypothetical protein TIFTF001_026183 [Ficus carica]|uniref:Uncharacterized protein n=1 Tax=Ficus carica TaxID=3494 RepID=A0AA88IXQ1_FICCA|nr:hypothetical protein TIFTF001_026183 [Ficus carica]